MLPRDPKLVEAAEIVRDAATLHSAQTEAAAEVLTRGATVHAEAITELAHGIRDGAGEIRRVVDDAVDTLVLIGLGIVCALAFHALVTTVTEWARDGD